MSPSWQSFLNRFPYPFSRRQRRRQARIGAPKRRFYFRPLMEALEARHLLTAVLPGFNDFDVPLVPTNTAWGRNDDGTYPTASTAAGTPTGTPVAQPLGFTINF